jgi:dTMP kinase
VLTPVRGLLVAFEGLDQSGKQTQAGILRDRLAADARDSRLVSFPDYTTPIGADIGRALHGERDYPADVMQLLYVANRHERKAEMEGWLSAGLIVVCDRYRASSVAYGEAQGLEVGWLETIQSGLRQPDLTILLDIRPDVAVGRKQAGRDKYERDLALLARVRDSYHRQAAAGGWLHLDGARARDAVAAEVFSAVSSRLAPR